MTDRLAGKVIVITGGGAGLGRECALIWGTLGARLAVTDINGSRAEAVAAEVRTAGGTAIGYRMDVTAEAEVQAGVARAVAEFGRLDVMFANAGIPVEGFGAIALEDLPVEVWDRVNDVVYKGVFFSGKHAARQFIAQGGGGNIVVTTSAGGLSAYPGFGAYSAGKAGAIGLVRTMSLDWGRHGIRVNTLAPTHGMAATFAMGTDAEVVPLSYEEAAVAQAGGWDPVTMFPGPLKLDRAPNLRDNANVATFLVSDDSQYMSGVCIPSCDGGNFARTSIPM